MAITEAQFGAIANLIADGELDDWMVDLQKAVDQRNERRKDEILKLVQSAWGKDAKVVTSDEPNVFVRKAVARGEAAPRDPRAPVEYVPDVGPPLPGGAQDAMSAAWPTPIESQSVGGGGAAPFSPVPDPMAGGGGSDPFGDRNPDIVSTGAQIG